MIYVYHAKWFMSNSLIYLFSFYKFVALHKDKCLQSFKNFHGMNNDER